MTMAIIRDFFSDTLDDHTLHDSISHVVVWKVRKAERNGLREKVPLERTLYPSVDEQPPVAKQQATARTARTIRERIAPRCRFNRA